jgi:hypothetical protein
MGPAILRLRMGFIVEARFATHISLSFLDSSSMTSANRADGISEIEGKIAMDSGERVGKGVSFKSVARLHFWRNASENFTKYINERSELTSQ